MVFYDGPGERILAGSHVSRSEEEGRFCDKRGIIPIPGHAIRTVQCPSYVRTTYGPGVVWNAMVPLSCVFVFVFGKSVPEALLRLEEVLAQLSDFGLQLKAKKCIFMQTEVAFLGHIVGRTGLACDPENLSAVRNWHEPNRVKAV